MSEEEKRIIEKRFEIMDLLPNLADYPILIKYFDVDSDNMLDEKIMVLKEIAVGKKPDEIPCFYSIFELLPKEGIWD